MSLHEYKASMSLAIQDPPFYALIMAAMRRADSINCVKLRAAFPSVWEELQERYNAPGGALFSDPPPHRDAGDAGEEYSD